MNPILLIFKKELRDMFRDKRVRSMAFITPPAIIVAFMFVIGFLMNSTTAPANLKIYCVKGTPAVVEQGFRAQNWTVTEINSVDEGRELIKRGEAKVVMAFPSEEFKQLPTEGPKILFDPKRDISQSLEQAASKVYSQVAIQMLLAEQHLPAALASVLQPQEEQVQVGGKSEVNAMVVSLLPYLIVIWAFYGGMSIATELVAGEKEKNTLETLLIAPASRAQIALGKYFSLCVVCLVSSLSSFLGLVIVAESGTSIAAKLFPHGLGISALTCGVTLLVLIPTVAFFASLLMAVSTFAKNPREAQTYLAGVSFLVLIPAMCSQFIGFTDFANSPWLYAIPVLNTATIIRQALQSQLNMLSVGTCIGVSIVLAILGIRAAVALFHRESVLARI